MSFESTLYILGICLSFFQINPLQIFVIFDMSFLWIACSLNNVSLKPFSNLLLGIYQPFVMRYWEILTLLFCFIFCLFYFLSFIALLQYCDIESLDSSMMFFPCGFVYIAMHVCVYFTHLPQICLDILSVQLKYRNLTQFLSFYPPTHTSKLSNYFTYILSLLYQILLCNTF